MNKHKYLRKNRTARKHNISIVLYAAHPRLLLSAEKLYSVLSVVLTSERKIGNIAAHHTMSKVFVFNIPKDFTVNDLIKLLNLANIPFQNNRRPKIMRSRRHANNSQFTGRYTILTFDSEDIANAAIHAINETVRTNNRLAKMRAATFIPHLNQYRENPKKTIVVHNLLGEINSGDLKKLFSKYGTVCSAATFGPKTDRSGKTSQMGYVLFENEDDALRAIRETNNGFLDDNKLKVTLYKTI